MYWFLLWRENKLSLAEILAIFPTWKIAFLNKSILILDNLEEKEILEKASFLWWTIKIIKIEKLNSFDEFKDKILEIAEKKDWKFNYWLSVYPENLNLKSILNSLKKYLVSNSISSRFINKDFKNPSSAQIIWEKLISKGTDFCLASSWNNNFLWITIWVQDIESYSKRDYDKQRDMQVWMLPPKLSQMMINLSKKTGVDNTIYDPFCWLWTILIEAFLMWYKNIYWSDLSEKMVETTIDNLKNYFEKSINSNELQSKVFKLNAKFINESEVFKEENKDFSIVTEWYLWEVMTKKNISIDRIKKQRESISKIYEWFFTWLKNINFSWNIVICFPFWEIDWKYFYFEEIYDIIEKYCIVWKLLPDEIDVKTTKVWSLLYKRDNQLVGREIFKLRIKKWKISE